MENELKEAAKAPYKVTLHTKMGSVGMLVHSKIGPMFALKRAIDATGVRLDHLTGFVVSRDTGEKVEQMPEVGA